MRDRIGAVAAALAVLALGAARAEAQGLDQKRIDEAIQKGVTFLRTSDSPGWDAHINNCDELILLTLIHAEVPEKDPKVQELLTRVLAAPMERTYKVALLAMCLEELDRVRYQPKIRACAQFLVDNQCPNGQWSYGEASPAANAVPTTGGRAAVASGAVEMAGKERQKPKVVNKVTVEKRREGPPTGDNSNAQYAALGLRACHEAGVVLPKETVIKPAKRWWATSQLGMPGGKNMPIATGVGPAADPRGWSYTTNDPAYGSMTAGAIGAVCIYDYILGEDFKKDKVVAGGMAWVAKNWSVTENIGPCETGGKEPKEFLYYYLYALERAGMLYDTAFIGKYDWYFEGARVLLAAQKPDGSWAESAASTMRPAWDTCFAILFLKRATRPLVVSVDKRK